MSVFGVILVRIFPHFPDTSFPGKTRTKTTPNTDTFHAVQANSKSRMSIKNQDRQDCESFGDPLQQAHSKRIQSKA